MMLLARISFNNLFTFLVSTFIFSSLHSLGNVILLLLLFFCCFFSHNFSLTRHFFVFLCWYCCTGLCSDLFFSIVCFISFKGLFLIYSSRLTDPHILVISRSENQSFFKIILVWWVSLWLASNLEDSAQISIILFLYPLCVELFLKISGLHFYYLPLSMFSFGVSQMHCYLGLCEPERRPVNICGMSSIPPGWLSKEHLPMFTLRSVIWVPFWFWFGFFIFQE